MKAKRSFILVTGLLEKRFIRWKGTHQCFLWQPGRHVTPTAFPHLTPFPQRGEPRQELRGHTERKSYSPSSRPQSGGWLTLYSGPLVLLSWSDAEVAALNRGLKNYERWRVLPCCSAFRSLRNSRDHGRLLPLWTKTQNRGSFKSKNPFAFSFGRSCSQVKMHLYWGMRKCSHFSQTLMTSSTWPHWGNGNQTQRSANGKTGPGGAPCAFPRQPPASLALSGEITLDLLVSS